MRRDFGWSAVSCCMIISRKVDFMKKPKLCKLQLDKRIGSSVRFEREQKGISREELAEMLDLTVSHLGLIERGERGVTALTLEKLSQVLKSPIDSFFVKPTAPDQPLENEAVIKKISSIISGFDEAEREFVIKFLMEFAALKRLRTKE